MHTKVPCIISYHCVHYTLYSTATATSTAIYCYYSTTGIVVVPQVSSITAIPPLCFRSYYSTTGIVVVPQVSSITAIPPLCFRSYYRVHHISLLWHCGILPLGHFFTAAAAAANAAGGAAAVAAAVATAGALPTRAAAAAVLIAGKGAAM